MIYNHKSIEATGPVEKLGSEMLAQECCKCTFIWNFKKNHSGDFSCISDRLILHNIVKEDNYDMQEDILDLQYR